MCACVIFMVICASVFAENWGEISRSAHSVCVGEKFLRSLRVINQLSTAKTICVLRPQHLPCRCFSLFIAPEWYSGAFSRKSTFLKIPISFTPLIPCPVSPRDNREKTERRASQNCNDFCPKIAIFPPLSAISHFVNFSYISCKVSLHFRNAPKIAICTISVV